MRHRYIAGYLPCICILHVIHGQRTVVPDEDGGRVAGDVVEAGDGLAVPPARVASPEPREDGAPAAQAPAHGPVQPRGEVGAEPGTGGH